MHEDINALHENLKKQEQIKKNSGRLEYTIQSGEVISLIKILDNLIRTIEECCDVTELYDRIVDKELLIRRINISANRLVEERILEREKRMQHATVSKDLG